MNLQQVNNNLVFLERTDIKGSESGAMEDLKSFLSQHKKALEEQIQKEMEQRQAEEGGKPAAPATSQKK